ncbi:MAG: hypothetical protein ACRDTG_28445 [Pseudonocardiaceae bacterium]
MSTRYVPDNRDHRDDGNLVQGLINAIIIVIILVWMVASVIWMVS